MSLLCMLASTRQSCMRSLFASPMLRFASCLFLPAKLPALPPSTFPNYTSPSFCFTLQVRYDPDATGPRHLLAAVEGVGFTAQPYAEQRLGEPHVEGIARCTCAAAGSVQSHSSRPCLLETISIPISISTSHADFVEAGRAESTGLSISVPIL